MSELQPGHVLYVSLGFFRDPAVWCGGDGHGTNLLISLIFFFFYVMLFFCSGKQISLTRKMEKLPPRRRGDRPMVVLVAVVIIYQDLSQNLTRFSDILEAVFFSVQINASVMQKVDSIIDQYSNFPRYANILTLAAIKYFRLIQAKNYYDFHRFWG